MAVVDAPGLAEALADPRLLAPEQHEEFVETMLPICRDVAILARELAFRGWLTPFQVEQTLAGQASTLILGSYVLLEPLGEGGMGRVFRARNWKLDRIVAIKLLRDDQARQPAVIARFQREIRALGRIDHPNIVRAIDADFRPGKLYYVMEFIEGSNLGDYVRHNGPLPVAFACRCIVQIADALRHAHDLGLIHRDIKPTNLVLSNSGNTVKLLDLGLTRCEVPVNDSVFNELTHVGSLIGTPDYMPPEQVTDSRSADIRSDIYSLGCTFYFMLTGRAPFDHVEALVDKLQCQCDSEPAPIEELRPDLPGEVAAIIYRMMAKRRRDRFQSADELLAALESLELDVDPADAEVQRQSAAMGRVRGLNGPMPMTEVLNRVDLELLNAPPTIETYTAVEGRSQFRSNVIQIAIAVLLATLALLILAQAGHGPRLFVNRGAVQASPTAQPE
jgi:serine/threonine-protein kinase